MPHLVGLDEYSSSTASKGGGAKKDESYVLQKLLRNTGGKNTPTETYCINTLTLRVSISRIYLNVV